jgi:hypothetical protein
MELRKQRNVGLAARTSQIGLSVTPEQTEQLVLVDEAVKAGGQFNILLKKI